jgi:uncharacterized membrane protein YedE/YeeE
MKATGSALLGILMGFGLSRIGFSDFGEVHRMFLFEDFRLLLTFAGAVALSMVGLAVWKGGKRESRRLHKGTVAGGLLFGIGWAVTGACPSIAVVQLGEGKLAAALTLAGIIAGTWLYPRIHRRFFGWDGGSCGEP